MAITTDRNTAANSTFAIGGVSFSADSFVVTESFVLRINICGQKPAHRKSAKRYAKFSCCVPYRSAEYVALLLQHNINISMTESGEPTEKPKTDSGKGQNDINLL